MNTELIREQIEAIRRLSNERNLLLRQHGYLWEALETIYDAWLDSDGHGRCDGNHPCGVCEKAQDAYDYVTAHGGKPDDS